MSGTAYAQYGRLEHRAELGVDEPEGLRGARGGDLPARDRVVRTGDDRPFPDRVRVHPEGPGQVQEAPGVVQQVSQCERNVGAAAPEHADRRADGFLGTAELGGGDLAEPVQQTEPTLGEDLPGGVQGRDEQTADVVPVLHRAVGEGPVRLLDVPVPLVGQEQVPGERRARPGQHLLGQRSQLRPCLRVAFGGRLPDRGRMLAADDRSRGVVVELDQLRSPPQHHRHPRRQYDLDGRPQRVRPAVHRSQQGRRPVGRPQHVLGRVRNREQLIDRRQRTFCSSHVLLPRTMAATALPPCPGPGGNVG